MLYNFGVPRVDFIFNLFVFQMVLWCPMAPRPSIRGKAAGVWGRGREGEPGEEGRQGRVWRRRSLRMRRRGPQEGGGEELGEWPGQ